MLRKVFLLLDDIEQVGTAQAVMHQCSAIAARHAKELGCLAADEVFGVLYPL